MEEFLKILETADADYWDEFLEKAKALHGEKFTIRKCGFENMSVYQIYKNGWAVQNKKIALEKLSL